MGDMLLRNISDAMKRDLAEAADRAGSMAEKARQLLRRGLQLEKESPPETSKSGWDRLRQILAHEGPGEEFADIMRNIESDRKSDFGRAPKLPE